AIRPVFVTRVMRDDLLQQKLREWNARETGGLQIKLPFSVLCAQDAAEGNRHAAAQHVPGARLALSDVVEIDGDNTNQLPVADHGHARILHADWKEGRGAIHEPRVELTFGDRRSTGRLRRLG